MIPTWVKDEKAYAIFMGTREIVANLYARWMDEKKYERPEDYFQAVAPIVNQNGGRMVRMTGRPFGFRFVIEGEVYWCAIRKTYTVEKMDRKYGVR